MCYVSKFPIFLLSKPTIDLVISKQYSRLNVILLPWLVLCSWINILFIFSSQECVNILNFLSPSLVPKNVKNTPNLTIVLCFYTAESQIQCTCTYSLFYLYFCHLVFPTTVLSLWMHWNVFLALPKIVACWLSYIVDVEQTARVWIVVTLCMRR